MGGSFYTSLCTYLSQECSACLSISTNKSISTFATSKHCSLTGNVWLTDAWARKMFKTSNSNIHSNWCHHHHQRNHQGTRCHAYKASRVPLCGQLPSLLLGELRPEQLLNNASISTPRLPNRSAIQARPIKMQQQFQHCESIENLTTANRLKTRVRLPTNPLKHKHVQSRTRYSWAKYIRNDLSLYVY